MKTCPKCLSYHERLGSFCSRSCANSRVISPESNELRRLAIIEHHKRMSPEERKVLSDRASAVVKQKWLDINESLPWEEKSSNGKRRSIFRDQNGECDFCKLSTWLEQPMIFELDHIDGDKKNNHRSNLRLLCPNCHSQTPTWRGRNKKAWNAK